MKSLGRKYLEIRNILQCEHIKGHASKNSPAAEMLELKLKALNMVTDLKLPGYMMFETINLVFRNAEWQHRELFYQALEILEREIPEETAKSIVSGLISFNTETTEAANTLFIQLCEYIEIKRSESPDFSSAIMAAITYFPLLESICASFKDSFSNYFHFSNFMVALSNVPYLMVKEDVDFLLEETGKVLNNDNDLSVVGFIESVLYFFTRNFFLQFGVEISGIIMEVRGSLLTREKMIRKVYINNAMDKYVQFLN